MCSVVLACRISHTAPYPFTLWPKTCQPGQEWPHVYRSACSLRFLGECLLLWCGRGSCSWVIPLIGVIQSGVRSFSYLEILHIGWLAEPLLWSDIKWNVQIIHTCSNKAVGTTLHIIQQDYRCSLSNETRSWSVFFKDLGHPPYE